MSKKRTAMNVAIRRTLFAAELMALGAVGYVAYKLLSLSNWDLFWIILKNA